MIEASFFLVLFLAVGFTEGGFGVFFRFLRVLDIFEGGKNQDPQSQN